MTGSQGATDHSGVVVAGETPRQLNYTKVRAYWKSARPSMLGPYMMDGFGFPVGAGRFRFRGEVKAVAEAIKDLKPETSVLDLGCGIGVWAEYFAQRFSRVVAVEASSTLYTVLKERCSPYPNVTTHHRDVLSFEMKNDCGAAEGFGSTSGFGLVFLGGLLMYLNDHDVSILLRKLVSHLKPGAIVLCRESTIRQGVDTLQGDYQVVYRSVETYRNILVDAGFDVMKVQGNNAYISVQMACELVKKWKALVPARFRCLPIVGRLAYLGFRLGYPWNTRLIPWLLTRMGCEFPWLTNHFFVLRPSIQAAADRMDAPSHGTQVGQERMQKSR